MLISFWFASNSHYAKTAIFWPYVHNNFCIYISNSNIKDLNVQIVLQMVV